MTEQEDLSSIETALIREIATILSVDEASLTRETSLQSLGLDSIRFVEILIFIEKEFDVRLMEAGLTRDDLSSVATLAKCVAEVRRS